MEIPGINDGETHRWLDLADRKSRACADKEHNNKENPEFFVPCIQGPES